ncbi:putative MFS family arabinose efflux permease [Rubricella aquisinus]|uniref:Putative MFS family arabinose efflux permease n=1 Tax=Rubricella aquisinus TaxID=2028108 RepID=A0A840WMX3_9RHOB|nr:MFS transporter [Rubricella aquisinus]MBB5516418.1 putative MFS family arabinose efflux permease [Rubricella aquisinus]
MTNHVQHTPASPSLQLHRDTATLMAAIGIVGANSLLMGPIAPGIAAALGISIGEVLRAAAAYGLGTALGAVALAPLIDRIGPQPALRAALAVLFVALGASAAAPGLLALIAAQGLAGLAAGAALPATYALAVAIAPAGRESVILGRVLIGWTLSLVGGVAGAALLADIAGWRMVYLVLAALCLGVLLGLSRMPKADHAPVTDGPLLPFHAVRIAQVPRLLMINAMFMLAFYSVYGLMGAHLVDVLGQPLRATGWIALSYGAGFGLAAFGDPLIDRFGARRIMPLAMGLIALILTAISLLAGALIPLLSVTFLWGLANHFGLNVVVARLTNVAGRHRGAVLGLYSGVTYLSASAAALIGAALYAADGFALVARFGAGAVFLGLILSLTLLPSLKNAS